MTAQLQSTPRHLAFISLALGFLVIWTAVLAGVLVSRTLKDEASAKETTKVFYTHEDVGKVLFALGHELGNWSLLPPLSRLGCEWYIRDISK
ncbi:unnamed protein product [Larinioides sclopetarius]|uniref:Uncharacterized protein n=1 Tax=Larinioides sclopetarius TaxID=280406 RepID=A0AAV2A062_9ARAC